MTNVEILMTNSHKPGYAVVIKIYSLASSVAYWRGCFQLRI